MKCYRRKGGFREQGDPEHCTDRVRINTDGRVEFIYESGRVSESGDPERAAALATSFVLDGHWEECPDEPFQKLTKGTP